MNGSGIFPDPHSKESLWEQAFEQLSYVKRIDEDHIQLLEERLKKIYSEDSYLTSPNYYLFTGRQGLWLYESGEDFALICKHPNTPNTLLIFPHSQSRKQAFLTELFEDLSACPYKMTIARARPSHDLEKLDTLAGYKVFAFTEEQETILDWQFPAHILSTEITSRLYGNKFMYVRNRLQQVKKNALNIQKFDPLSHSREIEKFFHVWAMRHVDMNHDYDHVYSPYETLLSLSCNRNTKLQGLMFYANSQLKGLSIWDVNEKLSMANLFVNMSDTSIKGMSELIIVRTCEELHKKNIMQINLGGSETAGLDHFKKKFQPLQSVPLCSIHLRPEKMQIERSMVA